MELQDIKQNSLVVEFEYVGNPWDRYAFITPFVSPETLKLYGLRSKIEKEIDDE